MAGPYRNVSAEKSSGLHEARMVTASPQRLFARGTDWRFLDELKRKLNA